MTNTTSDIIKEARYEATMIIVGIIAVLALALGMVSCTVKTVTHGQNNARDVRLACITHGGTWVSGGECIRNKP